MRNFFKAISIGAFLLFLGISNYSNAQTKGLIFETGSSVMDPNSDGYISTSTAGFSSDGNDVDEFEINMHPFPTMGYGETLGDIRSGPTCGFTDFSVDTNGAATYINFDSLGNIIFRFRLASFAPNAKGYTVLIDADNAIGEEDTNATEENPGFELAIVLRSKHEVFVVDIDGVDNCNDSVTTYPLSTHHQKSISGIESCNDLDCFYDFYAQIADLTTYFGITSATPLRFVATTNTSNTCALEGSLSDIAGVDDDLYGDCYTCAWIDLIKKQVPTPLDSLCDTCSGFPSIRTDCPALATPIYNGDTSVSGTSDSLALIYLEIHYTGGGVEYDTTTADTNGNWIFTSLDSVLSGGDSVFVAAQLPGYSISQPGCSYAEVLTITSCTDPIDITNATTNAKGLCAPDGAIPGAVVRVYSAGVLQVPSGGSIYSAGVITVNIDSSWIWTCNGTSSCNSGSPCFANGAYQITQQLPGQCESQPVFLCYGTTGVSTVPVITTDPIQSSTTSISGTSDANAVVYIYRNGFQEGTAIADGSGAWTATGLTFNTCDSVTALAATASLCASPESTAKLVRDTPSSVTLNCGLKAGQVEVGGSSTGQENDTVFVYHYDISAPTLNIDTFFLTAYGQFTGTLSNVLETGDSVKAYTTSTGCFLDSPFSGTCVVADTANQPTINCSLNYTEGDTVVTGTQSQVGAVITVFIDGDSIGSAIVNSSNVWTTTVASDALYTGGNLYVSATYLGGGASRFSDTCIVNCLLPNTTLSAESLDSAVCATLRTGDITIVNSEAGVIYQPYDVVGDSAFGSSVLGTGGNITLTTNLLTQSPMPIAVSALKFAPISCENALADTIVFTNDSIPDSTLTVTPSSAILCFGDSTSISVANSEVGMTYQLIDSATNAAIGSPVLGTGATVLLPTGVMNSTKTFEILVSSTSGSAACDATLQQTSAIEVIDLDPTLSVTASDSVVCNGESVIISVATDNSSSITYQVMRTSDSTAVGASFTGTGGVVTVSSGIMTAADTFYVVQSAASCSIVADDKPIVAFNNYPTAANDGVFNVEHGDAIMAGILANDVDLDGNTLTITVITAPLHGTAAIVGDSTQYSSNVAYTGLDSLTYSICDGICGCDTAVAFFNVTNAAPIANADTVIVFEGVTNENINVQINDVDPDGDPITTSIISGPTSGGSASLSGNNILYTPPTPTFNGNDTIVYAICDNGTPTLCDTDTVFILVVPVNDPPVANTDYLTINEDSTGVIIDVQNNDFDPEGAPLSTTVLSGPTSGGTAVVLNGDSLVYNPPANFNGMDTIIYSICDGGVPNLCDTDTVFITVVSINDGPDANTDYVTVPEDTTNVTIDVQNNDTDADGDDLTTTIVSGPTSGGSVVILNGDSLLYNPPANFNGIDTIIYSICDGGTPVLCDTDTVFITVIAINDGPDANTDYVTVPEDTTNVSIDVQINDTDADGDALTTTIVSGPTSGGTATVQNGDSLLYNPPANFNGIDTIIYSICDGGTPVLCDTDTVFITVVPVNDAPDANTDYETVPQDTSNVVIDVQINDTDVEGDVLTTTIVSGPTSGGTAVVLNGDSLLYNPPLGFNGMDTIIYSICDGGTPIQCDTDTVFINVYAINNAPDANTDYTTIPEDTSDIVIDVQFNDTDPDGDELTTTIVSGPTSGGSVVVLNGDSILYNPPANFNGIDTIIYSICDGGIPALCDTDTVFITVTPVNDAPIANTDYITVPEDTTNVSIDVQINDTDIEGDDLTTTIVSGPTSGGTAVVLNGDSLLYNPPANFNGIDTIIYSICDGGTPSLCDTDTVFITVTPVNDGPVANTDYVTVPEDTTNVSIDVQINDTDPEGDLLTTTIVSGPTSGGTATVQNGDSLLYNPPANFNGLDTIIYSICDGGTPSLCDTDTVFITVTPVNDGPVANTDYITVAEDTTNVSIDVQINDTDVEGDLLTTTIVSGPTSGGTATVQNGDSLLYNPPANFNGLDTIIYSICDGGIPSLCDTDTVFITVTPVNDGPVANTDYLTVLEDTTNVSIDVQINDTDVEGDVLTTTIVSGPTSGGTAVVLNGDSLLYNPPANFNGLDTIIYSICDGGIPSLCDTDTVFITVTPVNDGPVANTDYITVAEDTTNVSIDVQINDTDVEGDLLTTTIVSGPTSGGTATVQNGDSLLYNPPANFNGMDTIIYSICDGGTPSLCDTDTVFITVVPVNDAPIAQTDYITVPEDTTDVVIDIQINDTDPDGDDVTTTIVSGPTSGGTVVVLNGDSILYNPPADFYGMDTIIYSICDGGMPILCDTDTVFITVTSVYDNHLPVAENDTVTVDDTIDVVIDVLGNDFDPDSNDLTVTIVDGPFGGGGYVDENGNIIYSVDSIFCGTDSIEYSICDGFGGCDTAWVYITLLPADSDGDNIPDYIEGSTDMDLDNLGNYLDLDSDGDGIPDSLEVGPGSTLCNPNIIDTDGDGLPDYLDLDSDGDGLLDEVEYDANNDGIADDCDGDGIPDWQDADACDIVIPDGFSPNNDGVNDVLEILGLENYPENAISIFNRWGNMVYTSSPYNNDWDGTSMNKLNSGDGPLPVGTYFYVLQIDNETILQGFIYLSR